MKRWSSFMVLSMTGRVAEFLEIGTFGFALTRREETPNVEVDVLTLGSGDALIWCPSSLSSGGNSEMFYPVRQAPRK